MATFVTRDEPPRCYSPIAPWPQARQLSFPLSIHPSVHPPDAVFEFPHHVPGKVLGPEGTVANKADTPRPPTKLSDSLSCLSTESFVIRNVAKYMRTGTGNPPRGLRQRQRQGPVAQPPDSGFLILLSPRPHLLSHMAQALIAQLSGPPHGAPARRVLVPGGGVSCAALSSPRSPQRRQQP